MANTKVTSNVIADNAVGITQLNVSDGSDGQALVTNGAGTLSFSTISSGLPLSGGTLTGNLTMGGMILKPSADGGSIGLNRNPDNGNHVGDSSLRRFQINGPDSTGGDFLQIQSYNSSGTHQGNVNIQDGLVGIGETTPAGQLHIKGTDVSASPVSTANQLVLEDTENGISILSSTAGSGNIVFGDSGDNFKGGFIYDHSVDAMRFITNGGDKIRVHASGCVGVGSTTDRSIGTNIGTLVVNGSAGGGLWLSTGDASSTTSKIYAANNGSVGELIINNGAGVGSGGIIFQTNESEKMRILSGGSVLIGTTSLLQSDNKVSIAGSATGAGSGVIDIRNTSSNDNCGVMSLSKATTTTTNANRYIYFYASNFGTNMGAIAANGTGNVAFVATSDERLKENIKPITGSLDKILALNPVSFDWKANGEHTKAGFVAQEVESVLPEYVATDEDKDKTKGLTGGMTGGYIAVLTKALQEANDKITALEARVKTLEG